MKIYISIISILVLLLSSCSTNKVVGGLIQKRKYNKGFHVNLKAGNALASSDKQVVVPNEIRNRTSPFSMEKENKEPKDDLDTINRPLLAQIEENIISPKDDSVKITLKTKEVITGVLASEDDKGVLVKLPSGRKQYFLKRDILTIERLGVSEKEDEYVQGNEDQAYYSRPTENVDNAYVDEYKKEERTILSLFIIGAVLPFLFGLLYLAALIYAIVKYRKAKRLYPDELVKLSIKRLTVIALVPVIMIVVGLLIFGAILLILGLL